MQSQHRQQQQQFIDYSVSILTSTTKKNHSFIYPHDCLWSFLAYSEGILGPLIPLLPWLIFIDVDGTVSTLGAVPDVSWPNCNWIREGRWTFDEPYLHGRPKMHYKHPDHTMLKNCWALHDNEIYILDHQDDIQEYATSSPNFFSRIQSALKIGTVWLGCSNADRRNRTIGEHDIVYPFYTIPQ